VVLERALESVRAELDAENKPKTFEVLAPFLAGDKPTVSYGEVAKELGISLGAVKTQIHRLRERFAAAVRLRLCELWLRHMNWKTSSASCAMCSCVLPNTKRCDLSLSC
jgi:Sigma-70, region 4.